MDLQFVRRKHLDRVAQGVIDVFVSTRQLGEGGSMTSDEFKVLQLDADHVLISTKDRYRVIIHSESHDSCLELQTLSKRWPTHNHSIAKRDPVAPGLRL